MLRNFLVVAALIGGLFCIGVVVNADAGRHALNLRAPTFVASAALLDLVPDGG